MPIHNDTPNRSTKNCTYYRVSAARPRSTALNHVENLRGSSVCLQVYTGWHWLCFGTRFSCQRYIHKIIHATIHVGRTWAHLLPLTSNLTPNKKGHIVIATARREEVVRLLRNDGMIALPLEVTNQGSITSCVDQVAKITDGQLDILINNA